MSSCSGPSAASTPVVRHCAYCLKELRGDEIKRCVRCHKRAYCSRECQAVDWHTDANVKGQGHKDWCGIEYGEEDIDWKVTPIEGKGLGLVALRDIPVASRIIVEGGVSQHHPAVADLMPLNGTLGEKWALNNLTYILNKDGGSHRTVCLRISRANHSCNPNAAHIYESNVKVIILFSLRDIKEGEEICISYVAFAPFGDDETRNAARDTLAEAWGIVCNEDCTCNDALYREKFRYAKGLSKIQFEVSSEKKLKQALDIIKRLLELGEELGTLAFRRQALLDGFTVGVGGKNTLNLAREYITKAYEMEKGIFHPVHCYMVKRYKILMEHPEIHENYMVYNFA